MDKEGIPPDQQCLTIEAKAQDEEAPLFTQPPEQLIFWIREQMRLGEERTWASIIAKLQDLDQADGGERVFDPKRARRTPEPAPGPTPEPASSSTSRLTSSA